METLKRSIVLFVCVCMVAALFSAVTHAADRKVVVPINQEFPMRTEGFDLLFSVKDKLTPLQMSGFKTIILKFNPGWRPAATNATLAIAPETWFPGAGAEEQCEIFFHWVDVFDDKLTIDLENVNNTTPEADNERSDWRITQDAIDAGLSFDLKFSVWWAESESAATDNVVLETVTLVYDDFLGPASEEESSEDPSSGVSSVSSQDGSSEPSAEILPGDVNQDGKVDIKDAVTLLRYIADMLDLEPDQLTAADYNADTKVDIKDVVSLLRTLAG